MRTARAIANVFAAFLVFVAVTPTQPVLAQPQKWTGAAAGGGELNFAPRLTGDGQTTGRGWVLFDAQGRGVAGGATVHLFLNTEKLHVGIERLSFAKGRLAFFAFLEGEAPLALLLRDYFVQGREIREFGFNAGYVLLSTKLQWYPGKHQTIEILLPVRRWWFWDTDETSSTLELPPDMWVFEPRIGYNFWKIDSPTTEWEAQRVFPRIRGVAVGATGGLDLRSAARAWGLSDGRNDPGRPIYLVSQWLKGGWQFVPLARLQLEQWASYGWNQDDITRQRIGGTNPYVIPVPGLPWPALISGRLVSAQASMHLRARPTSPHEFGLLIGGGAFNDVFRNGDLDAFGGAGGLGAFADLRFGASGRYQLDFRFSWAFPVSWLLAPPYLSGLVGFGVRIF